MKKLGVKRLVLLTAVCMAFALTARAEVVTLKSYAMDTMDGLVSRDGVSLDKDVSSDGKGSIKIIAKKPVTVKLFETGALDVDNARIVYQARLRTQDVKGKVYLEMWANFLDKGEFFSRGLQATLSGTNEWSTVQTPFMLQKGQKPDNVKLNLVIDGTGTVWIDDVKLLKTSLK